MKKILGLGFAVIFVAVAFGMIWETSADNHTTEASQAERKAPNFTLSDIEGKTVQLSDYDGQIRIVDFWATWCPPCKAEIPHFIALAKKYPNVAVLGISLDQGGSKIVKEFAEEYGVNYPMLMGNRETVEAYGDIRSIPTTFVIDQQGQIIKKYVGYRAQDVFEKDILSLQTK